MTEAHLPWDADTFTARLREVGARAYHDKHPFHLLMNEGRLDPGAVRGWVANRFYYQRSIPQKDAAIVSNCPLREVRRMWLHRITDHDGVENDEGGIESWLRLGEACGLTREELLDGRHVAPGAQFAVDAYVNFARTQPWPVAMASSLTELFAPNLMATRLAAFEQHYQWVQPWGFDYFRRRVTQARRDSDEGLMLTLRHCASREMQESAVRALSFKCDVLWSMLDAIHGKYAAASESGAFASRPVLAPGVRLQMDAITGEPVLLYPEGIMALNSTAHEIVTRCDGATTTGAIAAALAAEYEVNRDALDKDVLECLEDLRQRRLIVFKG